MTAKEGKKDMKKITVGEICELAKEDSWLRFEGVGDIPCIKVSDITNKNASVMGMIARDILKKWDVESWRVEIEKVEGSLVPVLVLEI